MYDHKNQKAESPENSVPSLLTTELSELMHNIIYIMHDASTYNKLNIDNTTLLITNHHHMHIHSLL
jgi:hypothetical protein